MAPNQTQVLKTAAAELPVFLTVDETATTLRCSPKTIYRRIEAGVLPAIKEGGRFLIDVEVVRAKLIAKMTSAKKKFAEPVFDTFSCGSRKIELNSASQIDTYDFSNEVRTQQFSSTGIDLSCPHECPLLAFHSRRGVL